MLGDMLWKVPEGTHSEIPEASSSKDIARALRALFRISRGEIDSITITGGGECAFVAALAHWLFNFKIRVENETGKLIFSKSPEDEALQVHVQYGSVKNALVEIRGTTCLLGDFRDAVDKIPDENIGSLLIPRTDWNGCIRRVFGVAFEQLLSLPNYLVNLSAAWQGFMRLWLRENRMLGLSLVPTSMTLTKVAMGRASMIQFYLHFRNSKMLMDCKELWNWLQKGLLIKQLLQSIFLCKRWKHFATAMSVWM